jgi:uncharacterized protein YbjT (DUF2867 family)
LSVSFYLSLSCNNSFDKNYIMKTNNNTQKTLVLGGTGKTGSRVVNGLKKLGWPVRIGSRTADIPFDWQNKDTWKPVLEGMDAVYISFQPDLAVPGAVETIRLFTSMAMESAVKKIVLLSGRGEPEAQECEKVLMSTDTDWTIVRASWFSQNFNESHLLEPILAGYVALPAGNVGEPFIDADDIADVAVAALTQDGHRHQLYEVTGPGLLTFKEAIEAIAGAAGRPVQYQQVTVAEYTAMLTLHGVPEDIIWLLNYLFSEVLDGRNAYVTDGVERALGRKATNFSTYVKKAIATGAWNEATMAHH